MYSFFMQENKLQNSTSQRQEEQVRLMVLYLIECKTIPFTRWYGPDLLSGRIGYLRALFTHSAFAEIPGFEPGQRILQVKYEDGGDEKQDGT
jgi:hypothetical protein